MVSARASLAHDKIKMQASIIAMYLDLVICLQFLVTYLSLNLCDLINPTNCLTNVQFQ